MWELIYLYVVYFCSWDVFRISKSLIFKQTFYSENKNTAFSASTFKSIFSIGLFVGCINISFNLYILQKFNSKQLKNYLLFDLPIQSYIKSIKMFLTNVRFIIQSLFKVCHTRNIAASKCTDFQTFFRNLWRKLTANRKIQTVISKIGN